MERNVGPLYSAKNQIFFMNRRFSESLEGAKAIVTPGRFRASRCLNACKQSVLPNIIFYGFSDETAAFFLF